MYKRNSTWTIRITKGWVDGRQQYRSKGGFKTKSDALAYISELRNTPDIPMQTDTYKEMYDRWYDFYAPRIKSTTMASYKAAFNHYKSVWDRPIMQLTAQELQSCIDSCGRGRSTLDDMRTVCSLVYKHAQQNNVPISNPAEYLYCGA